MSTEIRPLLPADRAAVIALADRLTLGVAPWRDPDAVVRSVREWVQGSVDDAGTTVLVAADGADVCGFVTLSESTHWTGERDAYIGELVVHPDREGCGIGRALVAAAEATARHRGLRRIRLSTGAGNAAALALYDQLGYGREDVTLSKALEPDWRAAVATLAAAAPPSLRWMLIGSAASAAQGVDVVPGDVDILVHPDTTDVALEPLGTALARYAVGPATQDLPSFRSTPERPWIDAGMWRFGRWIVDGCKLEVARIHEHLDGDGVWEPQGRRVWDHARTARVEGRGIPVVALEVQLATLRSRGLTERERAVRAVLDANGWDAALYAAACAGLALNVD